jgi:Asp-tRNA(Asn)/Glu-tRNA(Gln) amidotransferase A subunit family amidase
MLSHQRALDHVGVFARTVEDVALIAEALVGHDPEDADTRPLAAPALLATCRADPPAPPRLALVRAPWSDRQEPEASAAFADLAEALGGHVTELRLGPEFAASLDHHRVLHETGLAFHLAADFDRGGAAMSAKLGAMIEGGRRHSALAYVEALAAVPRYLAELDGVFDEFDAILVPATTGVAPRGLESTGDPVFCTLWTLCGVPAVTLPLLENGDGLPIGVQLVGPQHGDARLLRTARWLAQLVAGQARRTRTTSGRRRTRPA